MIDDQNNDDAPQSSALFEMWRIARVNRWWKNVLIVLGFLITIMHYGLEPSLRFIQPLLIGLLSTSLLASSNYVLNEILDREADAHHPLKRIRGMATGKLNTITGFCIWGLLGICGLCLSILINESFFWLSVCFVLTAIIYNVPPIRLKDFPLCDIVCEGLNSPLRIALGWSILSPEKFPSPFLFMAFWSFGISAMSLKRRWELPVFESSEQAALYRKSFAYYTPQRLQIAQWVFVIIGFLCFILYVLFSLQQSASRVMQIR